MNLTRRGVLAAAPMLTIAGSACAQLTYPNRVFLASGEPYGTNLDAPWAFSTPAPDVMRFEIRTGDQGWIGDPLGVRHREEISAVNSVPFNVPIWQAWSQLIEPGEPTRSGFVVCNQWHNFDNGIGRQPCVSFKYENESLAIETNSDAQINPSGNPHLFRRYAGAMPARGVWHNFVARYVFGDQANGWIDIWLDGKKILGIKIPLGTWKDSRGPYNKFGIYCADGDQMPPVFAINYANMRVGTANLSQLVTTPLPVPVWSWGYRPTRPMNQPNPAGFAF